MKPRFELDSWGREIFPAKNVLIRLDTAIWVDLKTLEAMAAKYNAPHFVFRDVKDITGLPKTAVEKLRSLHFTTIPHTGLIVAFVPPSEGTAAANRATTKLVKPPLYTPPRVNAAASPEVRA